MEFDKIKSKCYNLVGWATPRQWFCQIEGSSLGKVLKTSQRSGLALFIVIGTVFVVSALAIGFHYVSTQHLARTRHFVDYPKASLLASSLIAGVISDISKELNSTGQSPLRDVLLSESLTDGAQIPFNQDTLGAIAREFPDARYSVSVTVEDLSPLDELMLNEHTGGRDVVERKGFLKIHVRCQSGVASLDITEKRQFRVVNLMPGVLAKFSFFVKDAARYNYNQYANELNGGIDQSVSRDDNVLPIIFDNGIGPDTPLGWKYRGAVFMGGGRVDLNLTSGDLSSFGEFFHFRQTGGTPGIPGYDSQTPPGPFFATFPALSVRHSQTLNTNPAFRSDFAYAIRKVISGYYTTTDSGNPEHMNWHEALNIDFPGSNEPANVSMRSSTLKLFGERTNPSPTLVMGQVFRRYAKLAGIVVDVTGGPQRDAILTYLGQLRSDFSELAPIPAEIQASDRGDLSPGTLIKIGPDITYPRMFGSVPIYRHFMSQLVSEPYLVTHDYMYFKPDGLFFPEGSAFGENQEAAIQNTFELELHPSLSRQDLFFDNGQLENLPADFLSQKAAYKVSSVEQFFEKFIVGNRLVLDCAVLVKTSDSEPLEMPPNIVVEKGGMVILQEGNILLNGVSQGSDPDQIAVFVAKNGDISVDLSSSSPLSAFLVALNGSLYNRTSDRPLNLNGGLALNTFDPCEFRMGGTIAYEQSADPSSIRWPFYYRVYVSDYPLEIKVQ